MDSSRKRLFLGLAIAAGVILVFLVGYLPGMSRARTAAEESGKLSQRLVETEARLAQTELELELARLRGRLGELLHEVNGNNFGVAGERAGIFFDGLRSAVNSPRLEPGSERRAILEGMLARRDEISADLARADAAARPKLAEMYIQFAGATK